MSVAPPPRPTPGFSLDAPDDAAFAARASEIAAYLLAAFPGLRGLRQHRPHFDPARDRTTDPIEHTLEMIALLDTGQFDAGDAAILRAAAVFHDVGKLLDPLNIHHAADSAIICAPYLPDFGLDPAACADALAVIRNHDVFGRLARYWLTAQEAADLLGTRRLAALTERLTVADISSIRGLGGVLGTIAAAYAAVGRIFDWREADIRPPAAPPAGERPLRWPVQPQVAVQLATGAGASVGAAQIALLRAIDATGSLSAATRQLGIPIASARRRLQALERDLGVALLAGRGNTTALTTEARDLIRRWDLFTAGLDTWAREHFRATFGVIEER